MRLAIAVIAFAGLPATVGIALVAPLLVPLFLGENWTEVVPILQVLAMNAVVYVILFSNSNIVYLVLGKPAITAYQSALRCAILLPLLLLIVPDSGAQGAAWALVATNSIIMIVDYAMMIRSVSLKLGSILAVVWRSVLATLVMGACVLQVQTWLGAAGTGLALLVQLAVCVSIGVLAYGAAIVLLWWWSGRPDGAEAYLGRMFSKAWGRLFAVCPVRQQG